MEPSEAFPEAFRKNIQIDTNGCWIWTGSRTTSGYGQIRYDGRTRIAHRWAIEITQGPIAEGLVVDHLCEVRACCNPKHLQIVTLSENSRRGPYRGKAHVGHLPVDAVPKTLCVKIDSETAAIVDSILRERQITASEFLRAAIQHELYGDSDLDRDTQRELAIGLLRAALKRIDVPPRRIRVGIVKG